MNDVKILNLIDQAITTNDAQAFTNACAFSPSLLTKTSRGSLDNTLLHDLIFRNKPSLWGEVLLQHAPDLLERPNKLGVTPLMASLASGVTSHEWFNALLHEGAKVHVSNDRKETLLHWASARVDGAPLIVALIERGAPVNALDAQGLTPLYHAVCCHTEVAVMQALLDAGADPRVGGDHKTVEKALKRSPNVTYDLLRVQVVRLEQRELREAASSSPTESVGRRRL